MVGGGGGDLPMSFPEQKGEKQRVTSDERDQRKINRYWKFNISKRRKIKG
jgi:hypothetical protein